MKTLLEIKRAVNVRRVTPEKTEDRPGYTETRPDYQYRSTD